MEAVILTWRNLDLADAAIRRALNDRLATTAGCSLLEHDLLAWLATGTECRMRMLDLAEQLSVTRGGLTRIVDRLVERGWITRERPESNRREVYAVLTADGRKVLTSARAAYHEVLAITLGTHLDDRDLDALARITGKLLDAIAAQRSYPPAP